MHFLIPTLRTCEVINSDNYSINNSHDIDSDNTGRLPIPILEKNTFNKDKLLPDPSQNSNVLTSSARVNCHRKVKFTDITIHSQTKEELHKPCENHNEIFSKYW